MGNNIEIFCPLGCKCEEIKNNKIHRCAWLIKLAGKNPQSDETYDEERCAFSWTPILLIEVSQTNRFQSAATESFRNEMVEAQRQTVGAQNTFNDLFAYAIDNMQKTKLLGK